MSKNFENLAKKCADAMWERDHASQALGMKVCEIGAGRAVLTMLIRQDMVNGHNICHGGFIFTLADSCFAFACNSYNEIAVAAAGEISFLAPAKKGDLLRATARETYRVGRNGIYDVSIQDQNKNLIAEFRGKSRLIGGHLVPVDNPGEI